MSFRVHVWPSAPDPALRRLNVGCGHFPLPYYINLDADPSVEADVHATVPPLPFADADLHEIYAGHVIEHLTRGDAQRFAAECYRCLKPGGRLGAMVPDTREIMTRWLAGSLDCVEYPDDIYHAVADLDDVCNLFLFSTVQPSHHQWAYDRGTLARLLTSVDFTITNEIDRYRDPRVLGPAWYQVGLDAEKPLVVTR